ncbi:merozoite-associated tryptophan-rich antigen 2 [Plasmodium falciparum IGH-CR14]|uniref:Merozoite-associated tryptophan-rich antigen 2 n=1 Tax=Plasmodium falciparum IGH-CR14 TaxID=580059 RepID=A0A0L1IFX4_PLAFA|nr:merozoite-associated tryptophan-rich antigen 2 [Plasmodium falciparum IGH-CR14]
MHFVVELDNTGDDFNDKAISIERFRNVFEVYVEDKIDELDTKPSEILNKECRHFNYFIDDMKDEFLTSSLIRLPKKLRKQLWESEVDENLPNLMATTTHNKCLRTEHNYDKKYRDVIKILEDYCEDRATKLRDLKAIKYAEQDCINFNTWVSSWDYEIKRQMNKLDISKIKQYLEKSKFKCDINDLDNLDTFFSHVNPKDMKGSEEDPRNPQEEEHKRDEYQVLNSTVEEGDEYADRINIPSIETGEETPNVQEEPLRVTPHGGDNHVKTPPTIVKTEVGNDNRENVDSTAGKRLNGGKLNKEGGPHTTKFRTPKVRAPAEGKKSKNARDSTEPKHQKEKRPYDRIKKTSEQINKYAHPDNKYTIFQCTDLDCKWLKPKHIKYPYEGYDIVDNDKLVDTGKGDYEDHHTYCSGDECAFGNAVEGQFDESRSQGKQRRKKGKGKGRKKGHNKLEGKSSPNVEGTHSYITNGGNIEETKSQSYSVTDNYVEEEAASCPEGDQDCIDLIKDEFIIEGGRFIRTSINDVPQMEAITNKYMPGSIYENPSSGSSHIEDKGQLKDFTIETVKYTSDGLNGFDHEVAVTDPKLLPGEQLIALTGEVYESLPDHNEIVFYGSPIPHRRFARSYPLNTTTTLEGTSKKPSTIESLTSLFENFFDSIKSSSRTRRSVNQDLELSESAAMTSSTSPLRQITLEFEAPAQGTVVGRLGQINPFGTFSSKKKKGKSDEEEGTEYNVLEEKEYPLIDEVLKEEDIKKVNKKKIKKGHVKSVLIDNVKKDRDIPNLIKLHLDAIEECSHDEWEEYKIEFLEICIKEFFKERKIDGQGRMLEKKYKCEDNFLNNIDIWKKKKLMWNKWIEKNRYIMNNWKDEEWFDNIKCEWENEIEEYFKLKKYDKNLLEIFGKNKENNKSFMIEILKIIWKKWIEKNVKYINESVTNEWINKLVIKYKNDYIDLKKDYTRFLKDIYDIPLDNNNNKNIEYLDNDNLIKIMFIQIYMLALEEYKKEQFFQNVSTFLDICLDDIKEKQTNTEETNNTLKLIRAMENKYILKKNKEKEIINQFKNEIFFKNIMCDWKNCEDKFINDHFIQEKINIHNMKKDIPIKHWNHIYHKWLHEENKKDDIIVPLKEEFIKKDKDEMRNINEELYIEQSDHMEDMLMLERQKIIWLQWINRNKYMLEKWNKEEWFCKLKKDWEDEKNRYDEKLFLCKNTENDKYINPMLERQKYIWRKWIAKHLYHIDEWENEEWFKLLMSKYEKDRDDLKRDHPINKMDDMEKKKLITKLFIEIHMMVIENSKEEECYRNKKNFVQTYIDELKKEQNLEQNKYMINILNDIQNDIQFGHDHNNYNEWKQEKWFKNLKKEWKEGERKNFLHIENENLDNIQVNKFNNYILEIQKAILKNYWEDMEIKWIDDDNKTDWLKIAMNLNNYDNNNFRKNIKYEQKKNNFKEEIEMIKKINKKAQSKDTEEDIMWKTVIEIHMKIIEEDKKQEWEKNKGDFLQICRQEFLNENQYNRNENSRFVNDYMVQDNYMIKRQNGIWNKCIERNRYILEKWKKEKWFEKLKNQWKNEQNIYVNTREVYSNINDETNVKEINPLIEGEKVLWKKWLRNQKGLLEKYNEEFWFKKLFEDYEKEVENDDDDDYYYYHMSVNQQGKHPEDLITLNKISNQSLQKFKKNKLITTMWIEIHMMILEECKEEEVQLNKELFLDSCIKELIKEKESKGKCKMLEIVLDLKDKHVLINKNLEMNKRIGKNSNNLFENIKTQVKNNENNYIYEMMLNNDMNKSGKMIENDCICDEMLINNMNKSDRIGQKNDNTIEDNLKSNMNKLGDVNEKCILEMEKNISMRHWENIKKNCTDGKEKEKNIKNVEMIENIENIGSTGKIENIKNIRNIDEILEEKYKSFNVEPYEENNYEEKSKILNRSNIQSNKIISPLIDNEKGIDEKKSDNQNEEIWYNGLTLEEIYKNSYTRNSIEYIPYIDEEEYSSLDELDQKNNDFESDDMFYKGLTLEEIYKNAYTRNSTEYIPYIDEEEYSSMDEFDKHNNKRKK